MAERQNPIVEARGGLKMPSLGLGSWMMGMDPAKKAEEVKALQYGLDLGLNLIDTAEMYGDGGSEKVVGEAIKGRRDNVTLVTKIQPHKANAQGIRDYVDRSLGYLGTDYIDLYLLHDRPAFPAEEILEAFEELKEQGKILHYGVSNHDLGLMQEWEELSLGKSVECNQLRYALTHRALESEILPWCEDNNIAIMAYSPVGVGKLNHAPELLSVARRHDVTPWCVAIGWAMRNPKIVAIPKASNIEHVEGNAKALALEFSEQDLADLDRAYPRPPAGSFDIYDEE